MKNFDETYSNSFAAKAEALASISYDGRQGTEGLNAKANTFKPATLTPKF